MLLGDVLPAIQPLSDCFHDVDAGEPQSAQATAGYIGGIGIDHLAHQIGILSQLLPATGIAHGSANHRI